MNGVGVLRDGVNKVATEIRQGGVVTGTVLKHSGMEFEAALSQLALATGVTEKQLLELAVGGNAIDEMIVNTIADMMAVYRYVFAGGIII